MSQFGENIPHLLHFFTFVNEFIKPSLMASYHKRYHGMLISNGDQIYVRSTSAEMYKLNDSFITHHWHLIQMVKEYNDYKVSESKGNSNEPTDFPMRVYVNYVLDNHASTTSATSATSDTPVATAQVLTYELWINTIEFCKYMQHYGTFPFEVYFNQLMRKMLTKCNGGIQQCRIIHSISEMEYKFLLEAVPPLKNWNDKYPLFKHELESFHWMYRLENSIMEKTAMITINPLSIPILDTGYYYNRPCNLITHTKIDKNISLPVRGGILADVTGSGKTVVALALIMGGKISPHDSLMSPLEDQLYFRSDATLIVTPNGLSQQWLQEINKFLHIKNLKIIVVTNMREFKKVKLQELVDADIVITTDIFLHSKRYSDEVSNQARRLIRFPFVNHEHSSIVNHLAWRIAVNKHRPGFETEGCVPLESIKWNRIIIDEIHTFLCPTRRKNREFPRLSGCFYWGLTGTPMLQNDYMMSQYVKFFCEQPPCWVPDFLTGFVEKCVHRFDGLNLNAIERHLFLIEHTEREKQLLRCYQDNISPDRMIQLCSCFNMVDVEDMNDMNQKIQLLTIDDIIKTVKKDKLLKINNLDSKIKHHDIAIRSVTEKIEISKCEMKQWDGNTEDIIIIDVTPNSMKIKDSNDEKGNPIQLVHDIRDVRDLIRSRKRRLDRMIKRRDQLIRDKQLVERSIGFFESKVDGMNVQRLETCPICMSQPANVITQCGHMFCRVCIIKCLKKRYQCPICKTAIAPTDAHEIKFDNTVQLDNKENDKKILRYGTKLTKILELIQHIITRQEKVVLVVQWSPLINCIREMFRENKIECGIMSGNVAQQNTALRKFKSQSGNVLLVGSLANTGLDLVCANHLIFVHALLGEEYMIKAMEDQSIARIHRNGQQRKVNIYWFISRGTIEEDVYLHSRCLT